MQLLHFVLIFLLIKVALSSNFEAQESPRNFTEKGPVIADSIVTKEIKSHHKYSFIAGIGRLIRQILFDKNDEAKAKGDEVSEGRTFGQKRIQFMLMPLFYKMGVMMTMIAGLTIISLKGLVVGVVLLILKISTIIAKFLVSQNQSHGWSPPPHQPVHVYHHSTGYYEPSGYSPWEYSGNEHYYYKG